jgi:hypothetical protein
MTQPPRIAMWMLKHFGSGPDNDTLLGDLAEQYQRNGSAMWYWRQALTAIPVSLFKEIRGHKWIAGGALLTGWSVWKMFGFGPLAAMIGLWRFANSTRRTDAADHRHRRIVSGVRRDTDRC